MLNLTPASPPEQRFPTQPYPAKSGENVTENRSFVSGNIGEEIPVAQSKKVTGPTDQAMGEKIASFLEKMFSTSHSNVLVARRKDEEKSTNDSVQLHSPDTAPKIYLGRRTPAESNNAGVSIPPAAPKPVEQGPSTKEQQIAKDGNSTDIPKPDEKAPPGMTVDDINKLNGGLLGKLGNNQDLKKRDDKGKTQIVGPLRDQLAKDKNVNGDINNDPDAAWRAYRVLTAVKNEANPDGSPKPDKFRHNGSIGGFTSARKGDAAGGSEAGSLQDYLNKGRVPSKRENQRDPHCGANGGGTTGLQTAGNKIKYAFEDFGKTVKEGFVKVGHAFVKLGHDIKSGFKHFGGIVKHGFDGIGAAIRGDNKKKEKEWAEARQDGHELGKDIKDGFKQIGSLAQELGPMLLSAIPGAGVGLTIAVTAAKFGAEMALKAGLKIGTKEFTEMAMKEGGKELAKQAATATAKQVGKEVASDAYQETTGEKPADTVRRETGEVKNTLKTAV